MAVKRFTGSSVLGLLADQQLFSAPKISGGTTSKASGYLLVEFYMLILNVILNI
jgi:hypothetical protein